MINSHFKKQYILFLLFFFSATTFQLSAQTQLDIWELMNRRDLKLSEIDSIANDHFKKTGKVRGTGYKQYERWKYEMQFHLDPDGYMLPKDDDDKKLKASKSQEEIAPLLIGEWTELGPFSWNRTSSWNPGVGRVTSLAVHPINNNLIYVTTPGGGLWKTTTGGNQWEPLSDLSNSMMDLFSVAVDPNNEAIVFIGSSGGNLFRSLDAGVSWTNQNSGMGNVRKIIINPTNTQIIYAVGAGIFKSTNGGNSFTQIASLTVEDIEFQPNNTNTLYASGTDVFRSLDTGASWTQLSLSNGINSSGRTMLAVTPANPQIVYAIQANGSEFGRFYRSTDGGNSFVTTIIGSAGTCTNFFGYETTGCGTGGQASYDMAITVNPLDETEVHIAGIIGWKSNNSGNTFVAETAWYLPNTVGYNHADIHALEWVGNTVYSGSDGGIYKSLDNGENWIDLSNSLGIRQFYRIANSKTNQEVVTGGAQDNGSVILKSTGWSDWLGADGMDCLVSPLNPNLIWGTSQYGNIYRTSDGGNSYTDLTRPAAGNWVTPLAIESNTNTIYGGWNGVYKSTNLGDTWTKLSGNTITSNLSVLAVAPSNAAYIYASNGVNLYVTKDGGFTWTTIPMTVSITSIAIHPTNPDKIWISSSNTINRVLVSINAGASFTNISGNLPSSAARSIVVDNTSNEGVYVGMNLGVYYLNKNTTNWTNLSDNLPMVAVNEVELQIASGKLRVGTYGRGIWERNIVTVCGIPIGLNATNILETTATVNWPALSEANSYDVDYKLNSSSTWINVATATTSIAVNLIGLAAGSLYDWRVRANCTGATGAYAQSQFTTTSPAGACPGLLDIATNGTYSGAALIPLNTDVKGTVAIKSDNDYYKFIITTGGTISLSLTTLPKNYELALLKSTGKQITLSQKTGTTSESINATVVAGTYYARVFPKSTTDFSATLCYTLKVATGTAARFGVDDNENEGETANKNNITLYPNPASQNLFVRINSLKNAAELNIYNLSGKLVLKQQANEPITEINISKLNTGMYILNVKDGGNFHNLKFTKE